MKHYKDHPFASIIPLMDQAAFNEFKQDIKEHGQQIPIVLHDDKILDGRNRYRACEQLGIEPRVVQYTKQQAKDYVISANFYRRHLTPWQKDQILKKLILNQKPLEMTNKEVAKAADVSESTVLRTKKKLKTKSKKTVKSPHVDGLSQEKSEVIVDDMGYPVPSGIAQAYWARKPEAMNVLNQIRAAKGQVNKLDKADPMWGHVTLGSVVGKLNEAINMFMGDVHAYVCTECNGVNPIGCPCCKGCGVISAHIWHRQPEEKRKAREAHASAAKK